MLANVVICNHGTFFCDGQLCQCYILDYCNGTMETLVIIFCESHGYGMVPLVGLSVQFGINCNSFFFCLYSFQNLFV